MVLTEPQVGPASEPTLRDVSEALIAVYGTDCGIDTPTWISRFTDMTRQAVGYRDLAAFEALLAKSIADALARSSEKKPPHGVDVWTLLERQARRR